MRAPSFWHGDPGDIRARLLAPLGAVYAAATARRVARSGWRAPVPVICCGNATAGGSGKTILALAIGDLLRARGVAHHFLLRGYGGRARGPLRVDPARHDAGMVGDEALLLAVAAPTWVAADRAAGARAAVAAGAAALVMDDGLQNSALRRDLTFLTIDGSAGFGNGRVIPAGPLREPVAAAAARCQAAVLIGPDATGAASWLPPGLPTLRAGLRSGPEVSAWQGEAVFAFCGIGHPPKFFASLAAAGLRVVGQRAFPDHHPFTAAELRAVLAEAERLGAWPVTTTKDFVRIPEPFRDRLRVATVRLEWVDPAEPARLLDAVLGTDPGEQDNGSFIHPA